jgi:hypothetical protein
MQIVEELEDRLGEGMDAVLAVVRESLGDAAPTPVPPPALATEDVDAEGEPDERWADDGQEDLVFDDHGDGAGVEGDLDMEED